MKPAIDPHSPLPLHVQVQTVLRRMLEQRPYCTGAVLPDEISLAKQLKVGRGTMRQAIGALVTAGLLVRRRGVGTRKAPTPILGSLSDFRSFSREMADAGLNVRLIAAQLSRVVATSEVANMLGVAAGSTLFKLLRVRGDDDGPIAAFTSWLHPSCPVSADDDFSQPLYDLIGSRGGPQPATAREELLAITADEELAAILGCAVGAPVLERRRQVCAGDGTCFENAVVHYLSNRFHLHLSLAAGKD